MRSSAICIFALGLSAVVVDASAQIPFLDSQFSSADLRLAGHDPLADEIEGFVSETKRLEIDAEAELQAVRAEPLHARSRAQRLRLAELQSRALATGLATARHAHSIVQARLPEPKPVDLGLLIEEHLNWRRLKLDSERLLRIAGRMEHLVAYPVMGVADGSVASAEFRLERARAHGARARAYESQANARSAGRLFSVGAGRLVITEDEVGTAEAELQSSEAELLRLQAKAATAITLRPPSLVTSSIAAGRYEQQGLALGRVRTEADRAEADAMRAQILAAEALVWSVKALQTESPGGGAWSHVLQVEATLAHVQEQRNDTERALRALRGVRKGTDSSAAWYGLLVQQETHYERGLDACVVQQSSLQRALSTTLVVQVILRKRQSKLPSARALALIFLTLVLGMGVLRFGGRMAKKLLTAKASKMAPQRVARLSALASLLWPVVVLSGVAAVIVWPILGLQVSLLEALRVVNQPLFYVDQTAVSPVAVLEFVVTVWAAVVISRLMRRFLSERIYPETGWDSGLTNALSTLAHYGILLIGLMAGLRFVGIGLSSLAIFAGVLGIGIGFGLRNITENFISGLIILAERPIKIGDFIEVKNGGVEGRVDRIQARSTTVTTRDNITMIIPNSEFVSRPVVNWSHGDPRVRISVSVGVAYGSDTDAVRKVLLEVAARHGKVLKKPAPEVQFRAFGASSLDFVILVWIDEQPTRFRIASDLHFAIDRAFRKRGIEIAFPQMDLHFKSLSSGVVRQLTDPVAEPPPSVPNIPDSKSVRARRSPASSLPTPVSRDD